MKKFLPLLALLSFLGFSCGDDESAGDIASLNRAAIEQYLEANELTAISTESGLYYIVEEEGNGVFPDRDNTVVVTYRGSQLDTGFVFDESQNPFTIPLPLSILGWQEGIPKFSVGGSGKLFIPANLAYGPSYPSNNGVIIFDVALLGIE